MNSVFAAATLACVSQALRLNAEPTAMSAMPMSAPVSAEAAPAVEAANPPMAASDDEHAGHAETFEESLESEEMHNEWRTHQV